MKKLLCGLIGVAGLAVSANAQPTWTTQLGFAQTTAGPTLAGNTLALSATGTYTFIVRAGIFNLQGAGAGQSNQGLNNFTTTATAAGLAAGETLGVTSNNSRISPFVFGPATSFGGVLTNPSTISNVNAARDIAGGASSVWNFGDPQPTAPTPGALGVDSLTNVWRFTVNVNTLVGDNIVINFAGQAGPVLQWAVFGSVEPEDGVPGSVNFIGIAALPLQNYSATSLTLTRVPAPGAAALLGLGGLVAVRRRRA